MQRRTRIQVCKESNHWGTIGQMQNCTSIKKYHEKKAQAWKLWKPSARRGQNAFDHLGWIAKAVSMKTLELRLTLAASCSIHIFWLRDFQGLSRSLVMPLSNLLWQSKPQAQCKTTICFACKICEDSGSRLHRDPEVCDMPFRVQAMRKVLHHWTNLTTSKLYQNVMVAKCSDIREFRNTLEILKQYYWATSSTLCCCCQSSKHCMHHQADQHGLRESKSRWKSRIGQPCAGHWAPQWLQPKGNNMNSV